jgi:hypothetical protein
MRAVTNFAMRGTHLLEQLARLLQLAKLVLERELALGGTLLQLLLKRAF